MSNTKFSLVIIALFYIVICTGCVRADNVEDKVWSAFINYPGNRGPAANKLISSKLIKKGTVDAKKALVTSTSGRIPAYLVKFKYNMRTSFGDIDSDMYVYMIENIPAGTHSLMWKGDQFISHIESEMNEHDFK